MKRSDRIKLNFTRHWRLPGRERLASWLRPSPSLRAAFTDGIVWLADEDIGIFTSADNYIETTLLTTGTYEDEIGKIIRISLAPGDTAFDIGANIGLQSIRMSRSVTESGKVYSFEPLVHLQQKLLRNAGLNRCNNLRLLPIALSNEESEAEFSVDTKTWNQGTFRIRQDNDGPEKQRVIIKVADDLPELRLVKDLTLIKIDVEGYEYHVLAGLMRTLTKHRPRVIFEYDETYWKAAGSNIATCFEFFAALDYQLYQITPAGCELLKGAEAARGGNLFCIPQ